MSNDRAEHWLRELGVEPEPEPDWIGEGPKADFYCQSADPFWVEVKTLMPTRHHALLGRAWNDLRTRCEGIEGATGDLYAIVGEGYDDRAARWLVAALEREAREGRRVDVVSIPADANHDVTARFTYRSDDGQIVQVSAQSVGGCYPLYPGLEPEDWGGAIEIACSDGTRQDGPAHRVLLEGADTPLAVWVCLPIPDTDLS